MADRPGVEGLMPSMLDRLIDPDSGGGDFRHGYSPQQMVEAVRRDLEDLLNSNQVYSNISKEWHETNNCLLTYGLPDLGALAAITAQQRQAIGRMIETIINRFEPRLRNVRARLVDVGDQHDRTVKFHIESQLNVDPAPEVAFETILELSTGHATINTSTPT